MPRLMICGGGFAPHIKRSHIAGEADIPHYNYVYDKVFIIIPQSSHVISSE